MTDVEHGPVSMNQTNSSEGLGKHDLENNETNSHAITKAKASPLHRATPDMWSTKRRCRHDVTRNTNRHSHLQTKITGRVCHLPRLRTYGNVLSLAFFPFEGSSVFIVHRFWLAKWNRILRTWNGKVLLNHLNIFPGSVISTLEDSI